MNEVTLSTQMAQGRAPRLSIKLDVDSLGVDWQAQDVIRVMSYKEHGKVILKRVGKKASKTVAYGLTKTGGGDFAHSLGLYVTHRPTRFSGDFKLANNVSAAVRFVDGNPNLLEVHLPQEIFQ